MSSPLRDGLVRVVPALIVLGLVAAVVLAVPLIRSALEPERDPRIAPPSPRPTERPIPVPEGDGPFRPRTYREGRSVVMPVTFPDGTTAEVIYSERLGTASIGPFAYLEGVPEVCHPEVKPVPGAIDDTWARSHPPLAEFPGADAEPVGFWRGSKGEPWNVLGFDFGSWGAVIACKADAEAHAEDLALVARSLDARQAKDGFLVVSPRSPLRLVRTGLQVGPRILFEQDVSSSELTLVELTLSGCRPSAIELEPGTAQGCLQGGISVYAQGDRGFLKEVAEELRIRNVDRPRS